MPMVIYFWVAIGGAIGSLARYALSGLTAQLWGETFPWGTLIVNIVGSFAVGFIATISAPDGRLFLGANSRQFLMSGICGGFTTFSSFSLQTLNLARDGEWFRASTNTILSILLCFIAVWIGHILALKLNLLKGS